MKMLDGKQRSKEKLGPDLAPGNQLAIGPSYDLPRSSVGRSAPPSSPTAALGSRTVNFVPFPSVEVALTVPFMAWTRCFTIDSPNPVPPTSRDRALSTR